MWLQEAANSAVSEQNETSIHSAPFLFKIRCNNTEEWTVLQRRCDNSNLGEIEFLQHDSHHNRLPCSENSQKTSKCKHLKYLAFAAPNSHQMP